MGLPRWLAGSLAVSALAPACREEPGIARRPDSAVYVGSQACARCHDQETELWRGSHHDLAMQEASETTVLGDFDDVEVERFGVTTTFFRRGERFLVRTDGRSGERAEFELSYTFGVTPLQQYLVAFPDGRFQALQWAWDSRTTQEGGQRWFHLYPDEPTPAGDELHWTGRRFNWNFACAECHSTDLRRNYDPASDSYATTYSEIDVACEACHGPGSGHVEWAAALERGEAPGDPARGLRVDLRDRSGGVWEMDAERGIARRSSPPAPDLQLDSCGRCHSRRWQMVEGYEPNEPLLDTHAPRLLEEELYWADGQILDEVFEWGSFLQSRMHAEGVRCTDCHEPHSLRLRAEGNQLCNQCHLESRYDVPGHHHHRSGGPGSACVDCHMPSRTYMQVDPRRDHSFGVPRPDRTLALGVPNACNGCHDGPGQDASWAVKQLTDWGQGRARDERPGIAEALDAARRGSPRAPGLLASVAQDSEQSAIARASALAALADWPSSAGLQILAAGVADVDALVRLASLGALQSYPDEARAALAASLLADPRRAVRIEAARALAGLPDEAVGSKLAPLRSAAWEELLSVERASGDTPEARLNLGLLAQRSGDPQGAETEYRGALKLDAAFVPAAVNLADLLREQGREEDAQEALLAALRVAPKQAALHHALGLAHVRAGRREDALASLKRAVDLAPDSARYAYVYGVALQEAGSPDMALAAFERGLAARPHDRELLAALALAARERGEADEALRYARRLCADWPDDQGAAALLREIEAGAIGR